MTSQSTTRTEIERREAREMAEGFAPEAIEEAVEHGAIPVTDLVRVLREMEEIAVEQAESGDVPSMFKTGVLVAGAGVRQQFGIEDSRYVDTEENNR